MSSLLSRLTVGAVGLTCKTFLNIGYCASVEVKGLENLEKALKDDRRKGGKGVITISNHISTLDDPVTWGVVPWWWYFSQRMTRWSLGASDIIFTNPVFGVFFRLGQTLETFRGKGIYQPAVDTAIEKLNKGHWIHLFGEGRVHQPGRYPPTHTPQGQTGASSGAVDKNQVLHSQTKYKPPLLLRFKWGVGRILMEAKEPPTIIPMWLSGFDNLMPEGRSFPWKYLPRRGVALSVTFGDPVPVEKIKSALAAATATTVEVPHSTASVEIRLPPNGEAGESRMTLKEDELELGNASEEAGSRRKADEGWLSDVVKEKEARLDGEARKKEIARIRSEITAVLQREVEKVGRRVLGYDTASQAPRTLP